MKNNKEHLYVVNNVLRANSGEYDDLLDSLDVHGLFESYCAIVRVLDTLPLDQHISAVRSILNRFLCRLDTGQVELL